MENRPVVFFVVYILTLMICSTKACVHKGTECIDYKVLRNGTGFEERLYPASKWITARTRASSLYEASRKSFMKLVYYIQAFNKENVTVELTTPHRTKIYWGASGRTNAEYSLSFPLPMSLYKKPPTPKDADVSIDEESERRYLIKRFGGRPSEQEWIEIGRTFYLGVGRRDPRVERNYFYTARYDMIYFINERKNEIWLPLRDDIGF